MNCTYLSDQPNPYDHPLTATVKDDIERLLKSRVPASEIAVQLGTSVGYVYKVASRLRKGGELPIAGKQQSISVSSSNRRQLSGMENFRFQVEHNDLLSVPPLTKEDLKETYRLFVGVKPWDIICQYGFNSEGIEIEHRRYLRMEELDIDHSRAALLKGIVQPLQDATNPEIKQLVEQFQFAGNLTDEEVRLLLSYMYREQRHLGIADIFARVSGASMILPEGVARPLCAKCNAPIPDVLVKKRLRRSKDYGAIYMRTTLVRVATIPMNSLFGICKGSSISYFVFRPHLESRSSKD